jgi:tRNA (guanine37-N1)-methyltransferase
MKFTYLSLFPDLIESYLQEAILKKAKAKNLVDFEVINLRDFSDNQYKSVDDAPYGGQDGMILRPDIAERAFSSLKNQSIKSINIYLSPQGKVLNQELIQKLLNYDQLVLLCGRYGGVDQRIINQHVDLEVSIGDYVLSGGELAALVLTETLSRFIPGVLGDGQSVYRDSFTLTDFTTITEDKLSVKLLEAPQYTKPQIWQQESVPEVLRSGHHQKITDWQWHISILITWKKRHDLFLEFIKLKFDTVQGDHFKKNFLKKHILFLKNLSVNEIQALGMSEQEIKTYLRELNIYET